MSNKLIIFGSNRRKCGVLLLGGKKSCLERIRGYDTVKEGGGRRHSFVK